MKMFKLYLGGYVSITKREGSGHIILDLYTNDKKFVLGYNLGNALDGSVESVQRKLLARMHDTYQDEEEELFELRRNQGLLNLSNVNAALSDCRITHKSCDELSVDYYDEEVMADYNDCADVHNYGYILIDDIDCNGDFVWCEDDDQYAHIDETLYGITSRRWNEGYFIKRNHDYCYSETASTYFINRDVAEENDYYWCNRQDTYVHSDDLHRGNNAEYHHLSRKYKHNYSQDAFSIGFEIEKEDCDAVEIEYRDLYEDTGWCKENDGSLCDDYGYELVSPSFNLYDDGLEKDIDSNADLRTLINANWNSDTCGGHINIGHRDISVGELFEGMSAFMPLLYSLYEHRVNKDYSRAKKKHVYHNDRSKYSSVYIKSNVLELRIFPAVRSVNNLIWRRDLVRIMCNNLYRSEIDILRMMTNDKSELYKHLGKIYTDDQIVSKVGLFIKYSREYNLRTLPNVDLDKLREKNKKKNNNKKKDDKDSSSELGA